ncbi:MAG: hypothetical protein GY754_03880 [bacterium]|nr:hypothetical protein [bacterium]
MSNGTQKKTKALTANKATHKKPSGSYPEAEFLNIQKIEDHFAVKLPKRYKEFISTGEFLEYDGLRVVNLPNYSNDTAFRVSFNNPALFEIMYERDIDREEIPGFIPLSALHSESQFLGVNIRQKECPVGMWERETGTFEPCSPSLDAFLMSLLKEEEKLPEKKSPAAYNKTVLNLIDLYINKLEDPVKALLEIEKVRDSLPDENSFFHITNYSGQCHIMLGDARKAAQDFRNIRNRFGTSDTERIREAVLGLEEMLEFDLLHSKIIRDILSWFGKSL